MTERPPSGLLVLHARRSSAGSLADQSSFSSTKNHSALSSGRKIKNEARFPISSRCGKGVPPLFIPRPRWQMYFTSAVTFICSADRRARFSTGNPIARSIPSSHCRSPQWLPAASQTNTGGSFGHANQDEQRALHYASASTARVGPSFSRRTQLVTNRVISPRRAR